MSPPYEVLNVPPVDGGDYSRLVTHPGRDCVWKLILQLGEPRQEAEGDHVVGFTAPHRLTKLEDRLLALPGQAPQSATQELGHPACNVVANVEGTRSRNISVANR